MLKKTLDALGLLHFIELANSLPGLVELFLLGFMGAALEQSGVGSLLANWVALGIVWLMIHLVRLSAESWVERQIEPILLSTPARLPLEP